MFKKLLGILIVISCFSVKTVHGQNIPVQASMVLVPPYTLSLADYASGVDNKLTLNILLKDLLTTSYQVKLRLTIEANGFSITTRPTFVPPPITLQGGVPEMLSGSDIDYYFDPANLDFRGLNKNEYIRTNKLPEGYYKFTIEVLDYNRSSVVSNKATVYAYIVLNDPPLINRPSNNSKVTTIDPVNIVFNWTPRHLGSPNSAFSTEYHFKLVEIWPQGRNAYEAMLTCPPLYEATVQGTSLVYDMMCPQLIPGKEYAFTITAADVNGRDMFKNGGTSETYRFIFGDDCKPPTNLTAKPVAGNGLEISWTTGLSHSGYNVNYRVKGSSTWYSQNTLLSNTRIYQLPPSSVVEYQVNAQCGTVESVFSDIYSAQTGAAGESKTFECGNHKALKVITNKTDVSSLMPGAIINAGGFETRITSVARNGNGSFTGECIVTIPYLNYAKVPHTFANIKVNELNEMYDGKLISKTNPNSPFVKTVQTQQQTVAANTVQTESGGITADTTIAFSGTNIVIDSVYYANDSTLVIVTNEGTQTVEQKDGEKTLVTDPKGNQYLANGGNVNKVGGEGVASGEAQASVVDNVKTASAKLPVLEFYPAGNARYGFDKVKYDALAKAYKEEKIQGTAYSIPWKAIETGGVDYVEVNTPNKSDSFDPASMSYAKESGGKIAFTPAPSGNVQLLVTSGEADDYESIEATYLLKDTSGKEKQALLGKLNVATYNKQSINLRIVPVNNDNTSTGELQSKLNEIYGQAVTGYNVQVLSNFDVEGLSSTATFEDAGTGALSHYTDDMKKIYNAFKKSGVTIDKEAYYIFLVPMGTSNGRAGFMPLGSQWGFIFTKNAGTNVAQTIAHELGHGAFKLYHTFSSNNKYTLIPNSTDNLMDYNNGVALNKYQWDEIHHPGWHLGWFDKEEDAAMMAMGSYFLSPNGKPVYLPASVTKTCFVEDNINCPRGSLKEFVKDGQRYLIAIPTPMSMEPQSVNFEGYKNVKTGQVYSDGKTYTADQVIKARKGYLLGGLNGECLNTIEEGDYKIKASYPNSTIDDDELNKNFSAAKTISENQPCQNCMETGTTQIQSLADYSIGSNGKSFLTQTEKDKLQEQINALSKALGGQYKLYLIDKTNSKAAEAREKASKEPTGTTGTIEYDGTTSSIDVKLDFKFPDWFSDFTVNADCGRAIVAQAIEELHNTTLYKNSATLDKILLEIRVATYKGFWAYVQCTFSEDACKNNGLVAQYVAGATFEFISIFNVEELLKGIYQLGKGTVTLVSDSYIGYFKDLASIYKEAKAGKYSELTQDNILTLLNKLTPPEMRVYNAAIKQICNVSKTLFNYYVEDVPTKYWRYGQLTIIVVPVILTAGEWAAAKGASIAAKLTAKYGAKAKEITTIVNDATRLDAIIVKDGEKLLVKEAEGAADNITVIEKDAISGEQKLTDVIDEGDLKKLNTTESTGSGVVDAKAGNKTDGWNAELNKPTLKPNTSYKANGYLYETDAEGRVSKVSGELRDEVNDRNKYQQTSSVKKKDGITGSDEGGHLIASIFKGPGEQINLLPMNGNLNKSAWKQMENLWAKELKAGKTVRVEIKPIFEGTSKRPSKILVEYEIDGEFFDREFINR